MLRLNVNNTFFGLMSNGKRISWLFVRVGFVRERSHLNIHHS
jgi:hypothetical protein